MTGEVLSRITTDTTLLLSVILVGFHRAAQCADPSRRHRADVLTSPKLSGAVLLIVPVVIVPIVVLGRRLRALSRENQDWIAESSGNASEALLSVQTVQAFTHERPSARISTRDREELRQRQETDRDAGGDDDHRHLAVFRGDRRRALDRRARRAGRGDVGGRADPVPDLRDHGRRARSARCPRSGASCSAPPARPNGWWSF
jgi:ABC-type multidrug transport system fused ATPase/permease subunit